MDRGRNAARDAARQWGPDVALGVARGMAEGFRRVRIPPGVRNEADQPAGLLLRQPDPAAVGCPPPCRAKISSTKE